ncbi:hypothetical protein MKX03_018635 [Papaver bracteatum]|nr:hypothetical protein MKX03_018635 [Papaver bracteatum]
MTVSATKKDLMIVNMGPHHPSMHGILHLIITLDGEDVIDCEPILATMFTEAIMVNGPEQLGNIQVPKRARYIRVIMLKLSRIASRLLWIDSFLLYFQRERERELIYDLFEAATCMRMMHNYFRIGGIAADLPHGWIDKSYYAKSYFLERVEGVGVVGGEEAINWGLSWLMLRTSGIQWDSRI